MVERKLIRGVVTAALAVAGCSAQVSRPVHVKVDVHACVSPPDGKCDPSDPNLGGIEVAIMNRGGRLLISEETGEDGKTTLEGDVVDPVSEPLFQEPISARSPDGSAWLLCPNYSVSKRVIYPDGSFEQDVEVLYGSCDSQTPQGETQS